MGVLFQDQGGRRPRKTVGTARKLFLPQSCYVYPLSCFMTFRGLYFPDNLVEENFEVWEPFTRTLGKKSVTWSFYKNANWERHQFDFDLRGNERFDIFLANFNMTKYIHFTKSIPRSCFRQETKNERGLDMCRKQKIRIFAKSILKSQSKLNFLNCQYMLQFFYCLELGSNQLTPIR